MPCYLITYDLRKPGRNYAALHRLLATTWKCGRVAESVWLGVLNGPASGVRDLIRQTVDANDRIFVVEIAKGVDWAAFRAIQTGIAIMKRVSP
jgi:hypothetical protein